MSNTASIWDSILADQKPSELPALPVAETQAETPVVPDSTPAATQGDALNCSTISLPALPTLIDLDALPEVIRFKNVTKKFGDKVAIEDVNFVVTDLPGTGELIALVGPSGCGKSTVLKNIAGLKPHFPPTSGEITIFGKPALPADATRGLIDQKYSLFPNLRVIDNIAFGLKLKGIGKKERREKAMAWVKKVGLEGAEKKFPHELSGGMQQRVAIASTLILHPRIILMDEPFGALDPKTRLGMQSLLVELWREIESTIFIVTHSMEEAVYLGDRIYRMESNPGRLVEEISVPRPDFPPEEMREHPEFKALVKDLTKKLELRKKS